MVWQHRYPSAVPAEEDRLPGFVLPRSPRGKKTPRSGRDVRAARATKAPPILLPSRWPTRDEANPPPESFPLASRESPRGRETAPEGEREGGPRSEEASSSETLLGPPRRDGCAVIGPARSANVR
ncbi:hypothetical protein KM043_000537 [Ampulex compressa]|nr:hypothetical protein KM043_000537 [Ampulex compressa]